MFRKGLILASFFSSFGFAGDLVKSCAFEIKIPGNDKSIQTVYRIEKSGDKLMATTLQLVNGQNQRLPEESVVISEHKVRSGLTSEMKDLNQAEQLIVGTMQFLSSPEIGTSFNVGLDLKAIRSARLYQIGRVTHMGGSFIFEAMNAEGKALGSFVTGFMPFACK